MVIVLSSDILYGLGTVLIFLLTIGCNLDLNTHERHTYLARLTGLPYVCHASVYTNLYLNTHE